MFKGNNVGKERQARQIIPFDETTLSTELECCYNEFKYYKDKAKNEIAALGFATSYNLQFLWQNTPKIDTIIDFTQMIGQTKFINSQEQQKLQEIQRLLSAKGIEPLKLYYTPYPRNTEDLKEKLKRQRAEKYSRHQDNKDNIIREDKRPIRFYTTLDWDTFYMNFPVVKRLSKDYLNNKQGIIYSKNFTDKIEEMLTQNQYIFSILKELPQGEHIFTLP